MLCTSKAPRLVKKAEKNQNGFEAWRRLMRRYQPDHGGRHMALMRQVLYPKFPKDKEEFEDDLLAPKEMQSGEPRTPPSWPPDLSVLLLTPLPTPSPQRPPGGKLKAIDMGDFKAKQEVLRTELEAALISFYSKVRDEVQSRERQAALL